MLLVQEHSLMLSRDGLKRWLAMSGAAVRPGGPGKRISVDPWFKGVANADIASSVAADLWIS
jgi:hypothetical protein